MFDFILTYEQKDSEKSDDDIFSIKAKPSSLTQESRKTKKELEKGISIIDFIAKHKIL